MDMLTLWIENKTKADLLPRILPTINKSSPTSIAKAVDDFHQKLDEHRQHTKIYVDGSRAESRGGIGVFTCPPGKKGECYSIPTSDPVCNVRAEALGLRIAATIVDSDPLLRDTSVVISDCQPAMLEADKGRGLGAVTGALFKKNNIGLLWCPSHVGILGNEIADELALAATRPNPKDDSQKLLSHRGINVNTLPHNAYRDLRWWRKRIQQAKNQAWQSRWNTQDASLKAWKPLIGPWKSKLSSTVPAERLLARLRLNRHHTQEIPGKSAVECRCGISTLSYEHTTSTCSLWSDQRSTLLEETRRTLEDPNITPTDLPQCLLKQHRNAFQEWKTSMSLYSFMSSTVGA